MTMLTLKIESGDAALASGETEAAEECARLLRLVASQVAGGFTSGILNDYNGNRCGVWSFDYEGDDDSDTDE